MHKKYMNLAIEEAKKGRGNTHTNPLVGAVIVNNHRVVAKGSHLIYGHNHAERNAIKNCVSPKDLVNSILYVTLEPCNHFGKQPPCSQLIVDTGIRTVVIGQLDPNPLVSGKGKEYLEKNGIEVIVGVEEESVRQLNLAYNFFYQYSRPYIALKQSMTLDGKIAIKNHSKLLITGKEVWERVHDERGNYQAVLVGSQTILADNPSLLTTQSNLFPPIRIVLDRRGRTLTQSDLLIYQQKMAPVWIFTEIEPTFKVPEHVKVIVLHRITIEVVLKVLTQKGVQSIYVEGGAKIHDAFLSGGYWEELITYISPKIIGGDSLPSFSSKREADMLTILDKVNFEVLGDDFRISGRRKKRCLQD